MGFFMRLKWYQVVAVLVCAMTWPAPAAGASKGLVIVAPESFHRSLRAFAAYKRTLLPTELVSLEAIRRSSTGADDAEKLKRYLYRAWKERQVGYALLAGDGDVMPVRYMVLDRVTAAAYDYAFYPSDLYYADLAKADGSFEDWNGAGEGFHAGYYGEVRGEKNKTDPINYDGIDYRPEIAVGRWPVSSAGDLERAAAKTMAFERARLDRRQGSRPRAALISVGGWVDTRDLMDRLAGRLGASWQVEKRYYSGKGETPRTAPPNHEEVRNLLNTGIDLMLHTGHGQTDAWEQCFNLRDLDRLTNAASLPVLVSAGCSTAYFAPLAPYDGYVDIDGREHAGTDRGEVFAAPPRPPAVYQAGKWNPTGLGEQVLKRSLDGAVAYIGCNTGSQPCALTLAEGFTRALSTSAEPRLGDCWREAVVYYYDREHLATLKPTDNWYPPSIFFQAMKFMVFGDPSLRMRAPER
jgi:hypothetical protein